MSVGAQGSILRTPADWSELTGIKVLDPEGWRVDGLPYDELITRREFIARAWVSTVQEPLFTN